ncbi:MAG: bL17 family ribosomal protein [Candidatus Dojkabacteria bacterium]
MYKRIKKLKLGRKTAHRKSLIHNLLRSLFDKNYVVTTTAKAKVLKLKAESLVSKGKSKKGELVFRRDLQVIFGNSALVKKYQEYVEKDDSGVGFVRVGFRAGDNAEQARVFLMGIKGKKKIAKKVEDKEKKKVNIEEKKNVNIDMNKKVDTTTVITRTDRAKSRSGL